MRRTSQHEGRRGRSRRVYSYRHYGPHPEAYHQMIVDMLSNATEGLSGKPYTDALLAQLELISYEAQTARTVLNNLLIAR